MWPVELSVVLVVLLMVLLIQADKFLVAGGSRSSPRVMTGPGTFAYSQMADGTS